VRTLVAVVPNTPPRRNSHMVTVEQLLIAVVLPYSTDVAGPALREQHPVHYQSGGG